MMMSNAMSSNNAPAGNMTMDMSSMDINSSSLMTEQGGEMNNSYQLVDIANYQSAQALSKKRLELYSTDLMQMASNNKTIFKTKSKDGLMQLNNSIAKKASALDIMMIVHTEIHPNLLAAFNLDLRE
jgi:hypothetical protein